MKSNGALSKLNINKMIEIAHPLENTFSEMSKESPRVFEQLNATDKPILIPNKTWRRTTKFTRGGGITDEGGEASYGATGLIVCLRFTGKNKVQLERVIERCATSAPSPGFLHYRSSPVIRQDPMTPDFSPNTPATARTAETVRLLHMLDSIESIYTFPLFKRTWVDETYDFNIKEIRSRLRLASVEVDDLGANYAWYADAVPIDAIFPPGIPLSAKEINAFYPHHVRWKDVMLRLTHNNYRGADIMGMQAHFRGTPSHHITPVCMNSYQRDIVKTTIPKFKTATYKGKSDRNLRTDHIAPGPYVEKTRKGFTLPTFADLVRGLQYLPSGLDARGLTHCLSWYLNIRNRFTPKLELNVIHTQALIRALRVPLKPYGPQNLDRNTLEEWRKNEMLEKLSIDNKEQEREDMKPTTKQHCRTQLHLNLDENNVSMNLTLPIRHILTFPFLALHGIVAEALTLGIDKAKMRRAVRKRGLDARLATGLGEKDVELENEKKKDDIVVQSATSEPKKPYRSPKRPRPSEADLLPALKKARTDTSLRNTAERCKLTPALSRSQVPEHPRDMIRSNRSWNTPTPSSSLYSPEQPIKTHVYSRQDYRSLGPSSRPGDA